MAAAITSWVLNPIQSLTMSRPHIRKLWCAVPSNLREPFSVVCFPDQDDIETLKEKIWEKIKEEIKDTTPHYGKLTLYSPVVQLNHEEQFNIDDGENLHPRRMITSNPLYPESKDPDVDIVVAVSGGATTQKRKHSESQSGESISFLMIFSCFSLTITCYSEYTLDTAHHKGSTCMSSRAYSVKTRGHFR